MRSTAKVRAVAIGDCRPPICHQRPTWRDVLGNFTLHVLVASDFDRPHDLEVLDKSGENVIATQTRVSGRDLKLERQ